MKRLAFIVFLLPLFLTAQQVPVGSGVPAPVQASASYQGKRGVQPIYYWVCTRFPSGYACMSQPAIASGTEGIGNLGGGNSVNLNWSAVVSGATGYDVIRQSSGGSFSGSCNNGCAIALNIHTTSYSDSSPSAGSNYPPAGLTPVMAAAGRIVLDNLDYATPTLVWVLAGITEPFCFPGSSGCGSSLGITALVGDVAAVGPGVATATVQGIEGVPFCTGYTPTNGEFVEYTTGGSPSPCYSAASASAGGITQLTGDATAGPGSGSQALTLATVNTGPGTCGDATHVCQITTNGKGLTTAQTAIGITAGTITGSGTVNDLPKWTGSTALGNSGVSDDGTTVSTAELWAAAQNTSTGDTDAGGNLNVTGNGNFGTGSGAAGSVGWCDTGCVHEQVWDGGSSSYNGTNTMPQSAPASGQVLTCVTASGANCALGWSTPGGGTANQNIRSIIADFGDFTSTASALSASAQSCTLVPISGTINGVYLVGNASGSVTIDVRTVALASYTGPGSTVSITASAIPALSSLPTYTDTTLTGWSKTIAPNTEFCFYLTSPTTITGVQIIVTFAAN